MSDYDSFLICFHEERWDIYRTGLPIGYVKDECFVPHKLKLADGSERVVETPWDLIGAVKAAIKSIEGNA